MSSRNLMSIAIAIVAAAASAGCQGSHAPRLTLGADALTTSNGIVENGIVENGIVENGIVENGLTATGTLTNGLAPGAGSNGLAVNGLTAAGTSAPEFAAWFETDTAYSDMVMRYVAKCALPEGTSLSYTALGGTVYSWPGALGVAPAWSGGAAIGDAEQQLVSACLAAHVNGEGQHVTISVRGYLESGATIAVTADEDAGWTFREACFFGNLFTHSGVYDGLMPDSLDPLVSTPRGCAAEFGVPGSCPPMVQAGICADLCTLGPDGTTWGDCRVTRPDGAVVHFRPVQTFLRAADVYRCGDGVCQSLTENATTCPADCAPPPPPPPAPVCGNGVCEPGEDATTCPADCAPPPATTTTTAATPTAATVP